MKFYGVVLTFFSLTAVSGSILAQDVSSLGRYRSDSGSVFGLLGKSKSYLKRSNDSALLYADSAIIRAKISKRDYWIALAKQNKSIVLREMGDWKQAIIQLADAIEIYENNNRKLDASKAYLNLGNIYKHEGELQERSSNMQAAREDFQLALSAYQKALNVAQRLNDSLWIAHGYLNMGAAYYKLFEDQEAFKYFKRSANIFEKIGRDSFLPGIMTNLGLLYESAGKIDSAVIYHSRAKDAFVKEDNYKDWISVNINLAGIYQESNPNKAISLLKEADSLAILISNMVHRALIQEHLYSVYAANDQYKEALNHLQSYQGIKDSMLNVEFKTEELNVRYETAKQNEMIERQKSENLKKELQLSRTQAERNRALIVGSIITVLLIALLLFAFWRQKVNRIIQRQKEKLQKQKITDLERSKKLEATKAMLEGQEKERIRIAEDLHDRLGSTLAAARMQIEVASTTRLNGNSNLSKGQLLIDRAIQDTRTISHNLISGVLVKLGLSAALNDLKDSLEATDRLEIDLHLDESIPPLDPDTELQLFRITQELVSNAIRHANASKLIVVLKVEGFELVLKVEDDGEGFDIDKVEKGLGIDNIKRRVDSINADFQFYSAPGMGSKFVIQVPLSYEKNKDSFS